MIIALVTLKFDFPDRRYQQRPAAMMRSQERENPLAKPDRIRVSTVARVKIESLAKRFPEIARAC